MIVGLDRAMRGKPTFYKGLHAHFTGYYHKQDLSYYWQVLTQTKDIAWVRNNYQCLQPDYEAVINNI